MRKSPFFLVSGLVMLAAALCLVFYNVHEDRQGGEQAERIAKEIRGALPEPPETSAETPARDDLFSRYEAEKDKVPEEKILHLPEGDFLGLISIPSLGIELPVQPSWSYPGLKISPCRYKGSYLTGDMIIAAHNYRAHFGRIKDLNSGDLIYFTDGDGVRHCYEVIQTEMIAGQNIEGMEFGFADTWDLTLFTCTLSGKSRVTVRTVEKKDDNQAPAANVGDETAA